MIRLLTFVLSMALCCSVSARAETVASKKYLFLKVTNLEDAGIGSLRDCISKAFPRVCIFETSGRIKLKTPLVVSQPDLVIAGQTAPSPGIMITNAGLYIQTHDVTVEHLAVRAGDDLDGPAPSQRDSMRVSGTDTYNVYVRHVSMSWGIDENFSTNGAVRDVHVEDSIISEALWHSLHSKGPHSMGVLVGETARRVSFVGNLLAANNDRNIRCKFDTQTELIGNVIYGWGGESSWNSTNISDMENSGKATFLDVIGNVYKFGPQTYKGSYAVYSQATPTGSRVYMADNVAPQLTNLAPEFISKSRVVNISAPRQASTATFDTVLRNAGTRPWERNSVDAAVIAGVIQGTLPLRDAVGTWPTVAVNKRYLDLENTLVTGDVVNSYLESFEGQFASGGGAVPQATPIADATPTDGKDSKALPPDTKVTVDYSGPDAIAPTPVPTDSNIPDDADDDDEVISISEDENPADAEPWVSESLRVTNRSSEVRTMIKTGRRVLLRIADTKATRGLDVAVRLQDQQHPCVLETITGPRKRLSFRSPNTIRSLQAHFFLMDDEGTESTSTRVKFVGSEGGRMKNDNALARFCRKISSTAHWVKNRRHRQS